MSKIDTSKWEEFSIKDIFITEKHGNKIQVPTGSYIDKKLLKEGKTPRITVSGINNGITGYYSCNGCNSDYRTYKNFISVSFLGTVFYQSEEVSLDMKVHCLKPKKYVLSKYSGLFLVVAVIKSLRTSRYSDQISSTLLPNMKINLPVDENHQPDFSYMESYMKNIANKTNSILKQLKDVI